MMNKWIGLILCLFLIGTAAFSESADSAVPLEPDFAEMLRSSDSVPKYAHTFTPGGPDRTPPEDYDRLADPYFWLRGLIGYGDIDGDPYAHGATAFPDYNRDTWPTILKYTATAIAIALAVAFRSFYVRKKLKKPA